MTRWAIALAVLALPAGLGHRRDGQANGGSSAPAFSSDGRYAAFVSRASNLVRGDSNRDYDVFVRDRRTHETTRVSVASDGTQSNAISLDASISANDDASCNADASIALSAKLA